MNIKELEKVVMANPMVALAAMKIKAQEDKAKLTPEERKANRERYENLKNERIRKAKIIANICPKCEGKLVRGKKNKKNDYKRDWACVDCNRIETI